MFKHISHILFFTLIAIGAYASDRHQNEEIAPHKKLNMNGSISTSPYFSPSLSPTSMKSDQRITLHSPSRLFMTDDFLKEKQLNYTFMKMLLESVKYNEDTKKYSHTFIRNKQNRVYIYDSKTLAEINQISANDRWSLLKSETLEYLEIDQTTILTFVILNQSNALKHFFWISYSSFPPTDKATEFFALKHEKIQEAIEKYKENDAQITDLTFPLNPKSEESLPKTTSPSSIEIPHKMPVPSLFTSGGGTDRSGKLNHFRILEDRRQHEKNKLHTTSVTNSSGNSPSPERMTQSLPTSPTHTTPLSSGDREETPQRPRRGKSQEGFFRNEIRTKEYKRENSSSDSQASDHTYPTICHSKSTPARSIKSRPHHSEMINPSRYTTPDNNETKEKSATRAIFSSPTRNISLSINAPSPTSKFKLDVNSSTTHYFNFNFLFLNQQHINEEKKVLPNKICDNNLIVIPIVLRYLSLYPEQPGHVILKGLGLPTGHLVTYEIFCKFPRHNSTIKDEKSKKRNSSKLNQKPETLNISLVIEYPTSYDKSRSKIVVNSPFVPGYAVTCHTSYIFADK